MPLDKHEPMKPEVILKAVDGLIESQQTLIDMQNDLIRRLMERVRILESTLGNPVTGAGIEGLKTK
jgi:hypothetical protein